MTPVGAPCGSCASSPSRAPPPPTPRRLPRPPGPGRSACAVACGSPTGACSPARCRRRATARSNSACCTQPAPSLVELTPGTRSLDGRLALDRRRRAEHYLPGGAGETRDWLEALLAHAERIVAGAYAARPHPGGPREEAFVGVAPRVRARGDKHAVAHTRFLWVDVDRPGQLPALWALLAERPCHLLIESGGSGGVHAYWRLAEPLPADAGRIRRSAKWPSRSSRRTCG